MADVDNFKFLYKDGVLILESTDIDLKIDTNRKIYVKNHDNSVFEYIKQEAPVGLKLREKQVYLMQLRVMLLDEIKPQVEEVQKEEPVVEDEQKVL